MRKVVPNVSRGKSIERESDSIERLCMAPSFNEHDVEMTSRVIGRSA